MKRKYRVVERTDAPKTSHRSFMFPECVYTLLRLDDGRTIRIQLSRSLGWSPGEVVELEDLIVEPRAS